MSRQIYIRAKRKILSFGVNNKLVKNDIKLAATYDYYRNKYKKIINNYGNYKISKKENKTVWICWLQGIEQAPEIVKKCYESIKKCFKEYKIVVLTSENIKDYVNIPEYILDKWHQGIISNTHFSDILRIELLTENGGIWIDSTVYSTSLSVPDYIKNSSFFFYKEINLSKDDYKVIKGSSWFIKSNKNNPILLLTRDLLREYWKKNNVLVEYFLFHIFLSIAIEKYYDLYMEMPNYNNINPHILQLELFNKYNLERTNYYKKLSDFHKLTYKYQDENIEDSNLLYILKGEF